MADVSHIGGLIAADVLRNPFDDGFDIVTTTTHKSLRGPRGGMMLCKKKFAADIDKSVFPGLQGGPHMNVIAGVAITLGKALQPEFKDYGAAVLANAKALAQGLIDRRRRARHRRHRQPHDGARHREELRDRRQARRGGARPRVGITTNKQIIPDDPNPPLRPSGVRIGTPAATARGMGAGDMTKLAGWMVDALQQRDDAAAIGRIRGEVEAFCGRFPVPGL